jgi:hypothetical protein
MLISCIREQAVIVRCGQLASLYHGLLLGILGPGAALSQTVAGCRDVANRKAVSTG